MTKGKSRTSITVARCFATPSSRVAPQRGLHFVSRSGHQIHMDDPDIVVAAVETVLRAYREKRFE